MNMTDEELADIQQDLAVYDEFHRGGAAFWGAGLRRFQNMYPNVPTFGLYATAIRYLDNQRDMADERLDGNVASEMTLSESIVRGILNPLKYTLSASKRKQRLTAEQVRRLEGIGMVWDKRSSGRIAVGRDLASAAV